MYSTGQVLPRPAGWGVPTVTILGAAIIIGAIAYALNQVVFPVLIALTSATLIALTIVFNIRSRQRIEILDKYLLVISSSLGFKDPDRAQVRASRWSGFFNGRPRRLRITYHPAVDANDPTFTSSLLEQAERRFGFRYRVHKGNVRHCMLLLDARPPSEPREPEQERRVRGLIRELLGPVPVSININGPDLISFTVDYGINPKLTRAAVRRQFERYLDSGLPGRWRAHWDLENDRVNFELRPEMPSKIVHKPPAVVPALTHETYMDAVIPYATDEDGVEIVWKPSEVPHMLIVGGTGSGKTTELHTLLTGLALLGWRLHVLDGKRVEFIGFRDWPNVELVASSVGAQVRMLHNAHDIMMQRYDLLESGQAVIEDFEPLVVIIDEYASFRDAVEDWYPEVKPKGAPTKPRVFRLVGNIARLGRTAKVHLVVGIQRPDVTFLGGEMRDNFGARTSLGRLSPQGAQMMWDSPAVGVTRTRRGHGMALDHNGDPVEVLTHYTPNPDKVRRLPPEHADRACLEALRPAKTHYQRMMVSELKPLLDLDGGHEIQPLYPEFASAPIVPYAEKILPRAAEPSRVVSLRAESADDRREDPADESAGIDERVNFADYGLASSISADGLEEGYAVCYDDSLDLWGVVTSVEPDAFDERSLFIEYQDLESGDPGVLSVPDDDVVSAREPLNV